MGKKSNWFSAIKRVFTSNSKDKLLTEGDKTSWKEKKGGRGGRLKHASFIPLFREPTSIEKILEEVDQQRLFIPHLQPPPQQQQLEQPQQQQQLEQPQQQQQQQLEQPQQQQQQQQQQQYEQRQQQLEQQQKQLEQQQLEQQQNQLEQQLEKQQQHERQQQEQQKKQQQQKQYLQQQQKVYQEQQQKQYQQQQKQEQPSSSSGRPLSPISRAKVTSTPPRPASTYSPKVDDHRPIEISHRPQPTQQQQNISATSIQAAYRGHLARRKVKGLTGQVRLQGVIKGQNVKRQTVNAMKQMQLLVRVQTQIQSRRIQMLENQALKRKTNNDKQVESSLENNPSEMDDEYWDDSFITKEERDARSQKKVEAIIKRERAMAYAYSHKLGKATPTSAAGQTSQMDIRTGGYPWCWLDRQLPSNNNTQPLTNRQFTSTSFKPNPTPIHKPTHKQPDTPTTPMSSAPSRTRSRTPPNRIMKYFQASGGKGSPYSVKDDDSMMSCPAFSVPSYMSPTISAKAKARPTSNPKDRVSPSTPGSVTSSKRRFSFPFTPNINNRSRNGSPRSVGNMSINSAVSVPASLGRKPFNRFV